MLLESPEFDRIRTALTEAGVDEPLTAKEIQTLLADRGEAFDSAHRVATILGRQADRGAVDVVRTAPYRYSIKSDT